MREHDLLAICLRKDNPGEKIAVLEKLSLSGWDELFEQSADHGVTPLLYYQLQPILDTINIPLRIKERLREIYLFSAARNMRLFHELTALLISLRDAGILVIYLKGAHLAEIVYENIALRPMGDIDLLVKKEDLEKASETLIRLGYAPERHLNIPETVKVLHHLPRFIKAGGPALEIHWNIEIPTYPLTIDMGKLWERAEKTSINGVETLTLSREDLLIHLCLHGSLHHGFGGGLKGLYDISQVIHSFGSSFDWGTLIRRSQEWGAGKIVYIALFMITKILRAPVPDHVLRALEPDSPDRLAMIMLSEELVFAKPSPLTHNMARLWGKYGIVDKLATCLKSVFLSREVMSTIYPVSASSLKIYLCYPLRIKYLFRRYGATICAPDREFIGDADIKNKESRLKDWLLKIERETIMSR